MIEVRLVAVLPVIQGDEDALRIVSREVNPFSQTLDELIVDLVETMQAFNMASLSAVQCGIPLRIFVTDIMGDVEVWMNPVVLDREGTQKSAESCASFPDLTLELERPERITVEVRTTTNEAQVRTCSGILARLVAHELDHLDGAVAQDHLAEEAFYAQLLGTAFSEEDDAFTTGADRRFDFLRDFQSSPSIQGTPKADNASAVVPSQNKLFEQESRTEDVTQILDLMADGTWKWVLALELLRDVVSSEEEIVLIGETEGILGELNSVQEYWETRLIPGDGESGDNDAPTHNVADIDKVASEDNTESLE